MDHRDAARRQQLDDEVAIGDGIERVRAGCAESEVVGQPGAIDGKATSGERTGAERRDGGTAQRILDPATVTMEHLNIGEEVMGQEDGLRALRVRVAGHHRIDMLLGTDDQRGLERGDRFEQLRSGPSHVQAQIERDLVITAAACMELSTQRAQLFAEALFDQHMDVLAVGGAAGGKFRLDLPEGLVDARLLVGCQHAGADQRLRPGAAAGDVLAKEPAVDIERTRELVDQGIRLFAESPTPGLLAQCETFEIRLASTSHGRPLICAAGPHNC